jgi:hypothetical protein
LARPALLPQLLRPQGEDSAYLNNNNSCLSSVNGRHNGGGDEGLTNGSVVAGSPRIINTLSCSSLM